jgi:predicted SAM-dependent methyltransferase
MYQSLKSLLIRYFPGLISRFEFTIRRVLAIFYRGNKVYCNVCNHHLSKFIFHKTGDLICPACGSLGRHRRLWLVLEDTLLPFKQASILHFSPSKIIQKKLKSSHPNYVTTDYDGKLKADKSYDITNIDASDLTYDFIICYHVLEHIVEDTKAMSELFRTLKNDGLLIVQTPFKDGEIYEDDTIVTPEERLKHFGQDDHVRIYSVQGLRSRLVNQRFSVEELNFEEKEGNQMGLKLRETILICRK